MGKKALAVCAVLLFGACGGSQNGGTPHTNDVDGESVRVWVEAEEDILPIYMVNGQNYLLGIEGRYYQVGLLNKSAVRVEVLVSVDVKKLVKHRYRQCAHGYCSYKIISAMNWLRLMANKSFMKTVGSAIQAAKASPG